MAAVAAAESSWQGSAPWLCSWAGIDGFEQRQLALGMRGWEEGDQGKQHPQHGTGVGRGKHRGVLCLKGSPSLWFPA